MGEKHNLKESQDQQLNTCNINCGDIEPPLGLVPKWVRRRERFLEVCGAIARYYEAGKKIPIEWVVEYNELIDHQL